MATLDGTLSKTNLIVEIPFKFKGKKSVSVIRC